MLPNNISHSIRCPHCGQEAKLECNLHPHPNGAKSEYLSYRCDSCKNGFTTTESDTISLKRYHSKKRSVYRKDKIKRLYENLDS